MRLHIASFFSFLKKNPIPKKEDILLVEKSKISISKILLIASVIFTVFSFLNILMNFSAKFSKEIPDYGGAIKEGVIGSPKYINPLLATSDTDRLITSLVFKGLMKKDIQGELVPDLATNCDFIQENKSYECTVPNDLFFSNKSPFSVSDVFFTFETKQKIVLEKDPINDWSSITTEVIDSGKISIKTTGSIESLREKMTLGIVPKSLWENTNINSILDSELNLKPIGNGPYTVKKIKTVNTIPKEIWLKRNPKWSGTKPFLDKIIIINFANQLELKSALNNKTIDSTSFLESDNITDSIRNNFDIKSIITKKNVSLFINQKDIGGTKYKALQNASPLVDRQIIIDNIENGYGIPLSSMGINSPTTANQDLEIDIAVQKDVDLIETAELLSTSLRNLGIITKINVFDQGLFNDQLRLGYYSFVLGTNIDTEIQYKTLIPLYTKSFVRIINKDIHTQTPDKVESQYESLRDAHLWYRNTDFIWKWFKNK